MRGSIGAQVSDEELDLRVTRAWAEVHGLATLWLHGNLTKHATRDDLDRFVRKLFALA